MVVGKKNNVGSQAILNTEKNVKSKTKTNPKDGAAMKVKAKSKAKAKSRVTSKVKNDLMDEKSEDIHSDMEDNEAAIIEDNEKAAVKKVASKVTAKQKATPKKRATTTATPKKRATTTATPKKKATTAATPKKKATTTATPKVKATPKKKGATKSSSKAKLEVYSDQSDFIETPDKEVIEDNEKAAVKKVASKVTAKQKATPKKRATTTATPKKKATTAATPKRRATTTATPKKKATTKSSAKKNTTTNTVVIDTPDNSHTGSNIETDGLFVDIDGSILRNTPKDNDISILRNTPKDNDISILRNTPKDNDISILRNTPKDNDISILSMKHDKGKAPFLDVKDKIENTDNEASIDANLYTSSVVLTDVNIPTSHLAEEKPIYNPTVDIEITPIKPLDSSKGTYILNNGCVQDHVMDMYGNALKNDRKRNVDDSFDNQYTNARKISKLDNTNPTLGGGPKDDSWIQEKEGNIYRSDEKEGNIYRSDEKEGNIYRSDESRQCSTPDYSSTGDSSQGVVPTPIAIDRDDAIDHTDTIEEALRLLSAHISSLSVTEEEPDEGDTLINGHMDSMVNAMNNVSEWLNNSVDGNGESNNISVEDEEGNTIFEITIKPDNVMETESDGIQKSGNISDGIQKSGNISDGIQKSGNISDGIQKSGNISDGIQKSGNISDGIQKSGNISDGTIKAVTEDVTTVQHSSENDDEGFGPVVPPKQVYYNKEGNIQEKEDMNDNNEGNIKENKDINDNNENSHHGKETKETPSSSKPMETAVQSDDDKLETIPLPQSDKQPIVRHSEGKLGTAVQGDDDMLENFPFLRDQPKEHVRPIQSYNPAMIIQIQSCAPIIEYTPPVIPIPDVIQQEDVTHPWYDANTGMIDAYSAFAHIEAVKSASREAAHSEKLKSQRQSQHKGTSPYGDNVEAIREDIQLLEASVRSVMVTNLPPDVSEAQIRLLFHELSTGISFNMWKEHGSVDSVSDGLLSDAITRINIARGREDDHDSDLCIGHAHVEFESSYQIEKILSIVSNTNNKRLLPNVGIGKHNHMVSIVPDRTATNAPLALYQIYIGNIPKNLKKEDIINRLKHYLKDTDVSECFVNFELVEDRGTKCSMGYGFLRVHDTDVDRLLDIYKYIYQTSHEAYRATDRPNDTDVPPQFNAIMAPSPILVRYGLWSYDDGTPIFMKRSYQKPLSIGVGSSQFVENISNSSIFICSIPNHITEKDLRDVIEPFGHIASMRILQLKRLCFLNMTDCIHAHAVLSHLNGILLKGYRMEMTYGSSAGYNAQYVRKEVRIDHDRSYNELKYEKMVENSMIPKSYDITEEKITSEMSKNIDKESDISTNKNDALKALADGSIFENI